MWAALPLEKRERFARKARAEAAGEGDVAGDGAGDDGGGDVDARNHDYCDSCGNGGDLVGILYIYIYIYIL